MIQILIDDTKFDLFKSKWNLELIKEYFQEVSDLVDGRIEYKCIDDKRKIPGTTSFFWSINIYLWKSSEALIKARTRLINMEDIKEQELLLNALKDIKSISTRILVDGLILTFRRDVIYYQGHSWFMLNVNVSENTTDEDYEDYEEDESGYDEEEEDWF